MVPVSCLLRTDWLLDICMSTSSVWNRHSCDGERREKGYCIILCMCMDACVGICTWVHVWVVSSVVVLEAYCGIERMEKGLCVWGLVCSIAFEM